MKKYLVVYYSNTGSNRFLANKIADALHCETEVIHPKIGAQPLLMLLASMKLRPGIKKINKNLKEYENIILVGPVWMGKFIAPLQAFLRKYKDDIRKLWFISCCGSSDEVKYEKFGHGHVFKLVKEQMGEKCADCIAFPIGLVLPEDKQKDSEAIMKTRLGDENFSGKIKKRFDELIASLKA